MNESKNNLTPEKMKVYEAVFAMAMKALLVGTGIIGFFVILFHLCDPETKDTARYIFAALEAALCGTTYKLYSHYFPSPKKSITRKN